MLKVSVIIPIFNVEKYLQKCLDTIKCQTLKDIEIICIDDGSTDRSFEILTNYAQEDSRFVILTQHHEGAAAARTKGLKIARGEYIGFVDSDDWIDLNFYETLYKRAVETDADIVRTTYNEVYENKSKHSRYNKVIERKNGQILNKNEHSIVIWNAIYKTKFLRENKIDYFDENLPMCHDVPFCARTDLISKKIVAALGTSYYYRKNRLGQLITPSLKRVQCALKSTEITADFINSIELDKDVYKNAYKRCIWRLNKTFVNALKLNEFDLNEQNKYLDRFIALLENYRGNDYPISVYYLLKNDRRSYVKSQTCKLGHLLLKAKKYVNYENNYVHKTITFLGIKLKFPTAKRVSFKNMNQYLKHWYKEKTGYNLNLDNPKTFNEKIQWLKVYDNIPIKTQLSDKYLVRDWVKEKIGEEYLIPLLGVWDKFEDIDFNKLPEKFVLKANHGSNMNIIVDDKRKLNKRIAKKKFDKWLKTNFAYKNGLELQYKDIKPLIIAEKYIEDSQHSLCDYKILCFNGKPEFIWIDQGRYSNERTKNIYNTKWELQPFLREYPNTKEKVPAPENLDKMIEIAEILSKDFIHVRVDLYNVDGKIYFGEMTFTSSGGIGKFTPEIYDYKLGEMMDLRR